MMSGLLDNITQTLETDAEDALTWQETALIVWIIVVVIIPTIALLGILGNIASMFVLVHHGLGKSYSIMLMALAVADSTFLTSMFLYFFVALIGFQYSPDTSYFVFYVHEVLRTMDYTGAWTSLTMPMLITVERLIALFFPLAFRRIVTTFRTKVAVCAVFVWWSGWMLFLAVQNCLTYNYSNYVQHSSVVNISNGTVDFQEDVKWFSIIELSKYRNVIDRSDIITMMSTIFHGPAPILFVFVGCVIISIKLKLTSNQRKKMTSSSNDHLDKSPKLSKANAMLLVVCFVYTNASMVLFILHSDVLKSQYAEDPERSEKLDVIFGEVINLTVSVNCSVNFLIYIVMNKRFRDTYIEMIRSNFQKVKMRMRCLTCINASELGNTGNARSMSTPTTGHNSSSTSSF